MREPISKLPCLWLGLAGQVARPPARVKGVAESAKHGRRFALAVPPACGPRGPASLARAGQAG
jgi:hypothetical protein